MNTIGTIAPGPAVTAGTENAAGASPLHPKGSGQFLAVLNQRLPAEQEMGSQAESVKDLLSLLTPEQLAQLMALLGVRPATLPQGVASGLPAAASGSLLGRADMQQLAQAVANWLQRVGLSPETLFRILSSVVAGDTSAKGNGVTDAKAKVNGAAVSVEGENGKAGDRLGNALLDLVKATQQPMNRQDSAKGSALLSAGMAPWQIGVGPMGQPGPLFSRQAIQIGTPGAMSGDFSGGQQTGGAQASQSGVAAAQSQLAPGVAQEFLPQAGAHFSIPLHLAMQAGAGNGAVAVPADPTATNHALVRADQLQTQLPALLVKQAVLAQRGGVSEMTILLQPDHLGELRIRILGEGGQVALQIAADTLHARALLDSGIGVLRQQLEAQGVQVNRVEVVPFSPSVTGGAEHGLFDGQRQQRHAPSHAPRKGQTGKTGMTEEMAVWELSWQNLQNSQFDVIA